MSRAPANTASLPDINAETYPFHVVQTLLEQAAFLNLYCHPERPGGAALRLPETPERILGFDVSSVLRRFDVDVRPGEKGRVPTATNRLREVLGRSRGRWMIVPQEFRALPDLEPPATPFDVRRSQRFVILDCVVSLGEGKDGFRCFGTGVTFPDPGRGGRVLAAAVGTLLDGFGKVAGHTGTCTYLGSLDPEHGFRGNVLCRIPDHAGDLRTERCLAGDGGDPVPEDDATYLVLYGRKPAGKRETEYLFRPDGGVRGLQVGQELHAVSLAAASAGGGVRSSAQVGPVVGSMTSDIEFDLLDPGAPGTAAAPIPFAAYNRFRFLDGEGNRAGSIDGDGSEGRTFTLEIEGAPGQRGLRFGGFGPLLRGEGGLSEVRGLMTDNSVVGLAPHATSTLYVLRLEDGQGRFRPSGPGAAASVPGGAGPRSERRDDPFEPLLARLDESIPRYVAWRQGFRRCSATIAKAVAGELNARLDVGEFPGLRVDPELLRQRFEAELTPFDERAFERYRGPARGTFRTYGLRSREEVAPESVLYSYWSPRTEQRGPRRFKRITGSFRRYYRPEEVADPGRGEVDLLINTYHPRVGVTSWVSISQHRRQERTSFAYRLAAPDEVLWIVKDVSLEGETVEDDVFMASHEWKGTFRGQTCYFMVGLFFEIDLDACEARLSGETFWRALYVEEPETDVGSTHGGDRK